MSVVNIFHHIRMASTYVNINTDSDIPSLSIDGGFTGNNAGDRITSECLTEYLECWDQQRKTQKILAIWVVSRENGVIFDEWCIKLQSEELLISIEFVPTDSQIEFGFSIMNAKPANPNLKNFMHYYKLQSTDRQITPNKWDIIVSVCPSPLFNDYYICDYLDKQEVSSLKQYIKSLKNQAKYDKYINMNTKYDKYLTLLIVKGYLRHFILFIPTEISNIICMFYDYRDPQKYIQCDKTLADMIYFVQCWIYKYHKGEDVNNFIWSKNQQFAFELFKFVIGNNYPHKLFKLSQEIQLFD